MANKYQDIVNLYQEQLSQISASEESWKSFLDTASRFYKYSFPDQVLIYAQKPEATACASYNVWNQKMRRYINKGTKGIALLNESGTWYTLKYVFDVSDTHARKGIPEPYIWQMRQEFEGEVEEALEASFGELNIDSIIQKRKNKDIENPITFDEIISNIAETVVEDNIIDYTETFLNSNDWGKLGIFENENKELLFKTAVTSSVTYTILRRLNPEKELFVNDLLYATLFNTRETMIKLGTAVSDISEMILREIESTIKQIENPHIFDYREFFAKNQIIVHNKEKSTEKKERSDIYESDIQQERRLSDTESENRTTETTNRQVRHDEKDISQGTPESGLQHNADDGNFSGTSDRDGPDSQARSGKDNRTTEEEQPRTGQRQVSDGVDTVPEQLTLDGGRNGNAIDLQIEQKAEETDPSAFSIGTEVEIDGKIFEIERVYESSVDLRDKSFENNVGFPIFRNESISFINRLLQEQIKNNVKDSKEFSKETVSDEKIKEPVKAVNFRITNENLGEGGTKTKAQNNIAAITLLKELEKENRNATPEEQEILSKYVGWGGIPQAFDEKNGQWEKEYEQIKSLLTNEEYEKARESTLTAFYTTPLVCRSIYKVIENMGFQTGNILEPSMGVGNFFGVLPEGMSNSKLYGVELDSISGRIAQKLYPNSKITIGGFEETNFPDSFFDVAIGNIPFGNFRVSDERYDRYKFNIHDYFIAKALDKVRTGGVVAFISSKGTLDKKDAFVRKYIAERAELLGAIRLPHTAFLSNANTEVTTDILFFQKRERLIANAEPDWIKLGETSEGVPVNQYFVNHPEMVLGRMVFDKSMYGNEKETSCEPFQDKTLEELLNAAVNNIKGHIPEPEIDIEDIEEVKTIPADENVRNFSFTVINDEIYYRENSIMYLFHASETAQMRIKGMIAIRDCVRELIAAQQQNCSNEELKKTQYKLNTLYENYTKKYGLLNSRGNNMIFSDDSGYPLLCSLEILNENGTLKKKADIFTKRTIKPHIAIEKANTPQEALAASLGELARIDLEYISRLLGNVPKEDIISQLKGEIFENPQTEKWETADEYLSGYVKEKLKTALYYAEKEPERYGQNVEALKKVQPKDLTAAEISVSLGSTWIPVDIVNHFMHETFQTPLYRRNEIKVFYSKVSNQWYISNKRLDSHTNVLTNTTYGTTRINGYEILQASLNLKDIKIFDTKTNADGNDVKVLNPKETTLAQQKQSALKEAFKNWIFKDPSRRDRVVKLYNDMFNNIVPRQYDGSYLNFHGINPEISLRPHQRNAVARVIYGGNTLLAHCVGAGKTFEMTAAAMELKALGLCNKSMFVVPNHLTEQWANEFLQLYPAANILVATKKDFEKSRRKKFCGRIATGEYDAVIIGHSQFEKISVSKERQIAFINEQISEIIDGIKELKNEKGDDFSIKQMERQKKLLKEKLQKMKDEKRKDDVVNFEELGIDRIFVDEAHYYKNLFLYTKMRNVAGISQTEAKKSSDLYLKCRYLDELTGNKGVIFATGTPISNSMTELYTIQRYLQYDMLQKREQLHFDCWASAYGETVTALELSPEGTGYRLKTRFAKFYNVPEMVTAFRECADIQTADMLKLPVPKAEYKTEVIQPTDFQKEIVKSFGERAEAVRKGSVDPRTDNMLKITNDGRKLALDQRLVNPLLPDTQDSKINRCVNNIYGIWRDTKDKKSTQLVFCDISTPTIADNERETEYRFTDVYNDLLYKLKSKGIPENEIAFIHTANTEAKKSELFAKVRSGDIRILIGSTLKMGAGTNVQDKLAALHHLDVPWRPSDIEQREGRIIRRGNENNTVFIYRYVTENTFDAYSWQLLEQKQRFISQVMNGNAVERSCDDIDDTALSFAELKALSAGDPRIKEKMDLDIEVAKLKLLKSNYDNERYLIEDNVLKNYPRRIEKLNQSISNIEQDIETARKNTFADKDNFSIQIDSVVYTDKKEGAEMLLKKVSTIFTNEPVQIGVYRGFNMRVTFDSFEKEYNIYLCGKTEHKATIGSDALGNIIRLDNALERMPKALKDYKEEADILLTQIENGKEELKKPFQYERELSEKLERLIELNNALSLDKKDSEVIAEPEETIATATQPKKELCTMER